MGRSSFEIRSHEDLTAFLQGKPIEWAEAIASRVSLRVFPVALGLLATSDLDIKTLEKHCMLLFRANFIAWVRSHYRDASFVASSVRAAQAAFMENSLDNELYVHCISAAAYAVSSQEKVSAAGMAALLAARAADRAVPWHTREKYTDGAREIWASVDDDCRILCRRPIQGLRDQPLWTSELRNKHESGGNLPYWAMNPLLDFAQSHFVKKGRWRVFFDWYMAIIPDNKDLKVGTYFSSEVAISVALQNEDFWTRSSDVILQTIADIAVSVENEEIQRLLNKAIEALPQQGPAAYRFEWRERKIKAVPPAAHPSDGPLAADLLTETRQKAQILRERLSRSNANPRVIDSIEKLLSTLPNEISDFRPGLVRSRFRSIEADAVAYRGSENEFPPDTIAQLIDLSETLRDLQACYPEIREIEAEALALDLAGKDIDVLKERLDEIVAAVDQATDIVDPSASEALHIMQEVAADSATSAVRERRLADYTLVVRNFTSSLLRSAGKEVQQLARDSYENVRPELVDIGGKSVKTVAVGSVIGLSITLFGPVYGIAAVIGGFGTIPKMISLIMDWKKRRDN